MIVEMMIEKITITMIVETMMLVTTTASMTTTILEIDTCRLKDPVNPDDMMRSLGIKSRSFCIFRPAGNFLGRHLVHGR